MDTQTNNHTEWLDLVDIAQRIGADVLLRNNIERVRPVSVGHFGTYRIVREPIADDLENTIRCILATGDERESFDNDIRAAASHRDIGFDSVTLAEWMQLHDIPVPDEWKQCGSVARPNVNAANDDRIDSRSTITLSKRELVELTGKHRSSVQHRVLNELGIPSKVRSDGAVVVLRCDLQVATNAKTKAKPQPNFDALVKR